MTKRQNTIRINYITLTKFCKIFLFSCIILGGIHSAVFGQKKKKKKEIPPPVFVAKGGNLIYTPDSLGNRIVDFSYCGYMASKQPIPDVSVKVTVPLKSGDATLRIQSALDYVANLPVDRNGFRGAVLLEKGTYHISGTLKMNASGVVLRGTGMGKEGTILFADGTDRATLIIVSGKGDRKVGMPTTITSSYVPVNATKIPVANMADFKIGDNVMIHRPCTDKWIDVMGTRSFGGGLSALGWKSDQLDIYWDRKIVAKDGDSLVLDAPLTIALDKKYGGGTIAKYTWPGRISQVGIENLSCVSAYDHSNPKDEAHRWMAITMNNIEDGWVRRIQFEHFAGSAVDLLSTTKRITVEDCKSLDPISEIGGQRRYTFWTSGQQTLFQRLYSEHGYHDFAVGYCAPGPNAFVQCQSHESLSYSGAISALTSGVLFDVIRLDGQALSYKNLGQDEQGAGWNTLNSVFWNTFAGRVDCYKPPTAENYAFGTWAQFQGDGYWSESNNWITPRSFFYAQLQQRLHKNIDKQAILLPIESEASSSPTAAEAAKLTAESYKPAITISDWINHITATYPISLNNNNAKTIDAIGIEKQVVVAKAPPMVLLNGWLTRGGKILTGKRDYAPWWNGSLKPDWIKNAVPAITRFVPGRNGTGFTDDLDSVTNRMKKNNIEVMEQNYALWYDRRRDDHERIRRIDGDVWAPFYELPFARTGIGTAWDGLSKYDLTKYNKWYWSRLKQFADLADEKGLVLIHHNYFQHNIIEAGAHYVDFPWRPVNNINNTGFPEPIHFAGDKRLFMADQFYNVNNPIRRRLHQAFIDQCLNNFKDNSGVIQFICEEYTGPLSFVQFWLNTILEWEKKTGHKETIGLSTTKDVQDGILADSKLAKAISVIDIRYWYYQANGTTYAPLGGKSLAPRQWARQLKPKATSFEQVYRAVREYKDKYPSKAVMYSAEGYDNYGWASFIAGGSLAPLPKALPVEFLTDAAQMHPIDLSDKATNQWALGGKNGVIVYSEGNESISVNLKNAKDTYSLKWINPETGMQIGNTKDLQNVNSVNVKCDANTSGPIVMWLCKSK